MSYRLKLGIGVIVGVLFSFSAFAEVIDLGIRGFVCDINKEEILNDHNRRLKRRGSLRGFNFGQEISLKYNSRQLRSNRGEKEINRFEIKGDFYAEEKKTIYVFSAVDPLSIKKAPEVRADFGICVQYNSLEDIASFREKTRVRYPIELGNDEIVSFLRLDSYPAIVTIEHKNVTVETGF